MEREEQLKAVLKRSHGRECITASKFAPSVKRYIAATSIANDESSECEHCIEWYANVTILCKPPYKHIASRRRNIAAMSANLERYDH
jgi:hypothetical protein